MFDRIRGKFVTVVGVVLCLFTLVEVNYNFLLQSAVAVFVGLGLVICFLTYPIDKRLKDVVALRIVDCVLAALVVLCCGWMVIQNEEMFQQFWLDGQSLGDRAGGESTIDFAEFNRAIRTNINSAG